MATDTSPLIPDLFKHYQNMACPVLLVSFRNSSVTAYTGLYRRLGYELTMMEVQGKFSFINGCGLISGEVSVEELVNQVESFAPLKNTRCLVIIEDLSILDACGISLSAIFSFVKSLESVLSTKSDLVISLAHDHNPVIWKWLLHRSTLAIIVNPLASGLSREFHGELVAVGGGRAFEAPSPPAQPFLYRTTESSLYLVAKGSQTA